MRSSSLDKYRYGFNGQEKENSVNGSYSTTSAEFWMYDGRLGRRWDVDPVFIPSVSSYSTFLNCPVFYSDPNGLSATDYKNKEGKLLAHVNDGFDRDVLVDEDQFNKAIEEANKKGMDLYNIRQGYAFTLSYQSAAADNNMIVFETICAFDNTLPEFTITEEIDYPWYQDLNNWLCSPPAISGPLASMEQLYLPHNSNSIKI